MKETKEQELKRLEDYWTATEPFLRKIIETEDIHVKRIAELKAELKAEMNPKLRNGDIWQQGSLAMYLTEWRIKDRTGQAGRIVDQRCDLMPNLSETYYKGQPIIANLQDIFDDLYAIQKPLEEFEIKSHGGVLGLKVDKGMNHLNLSEQEGDNEMIQVHFDDLPIFIRNLQRVQATAKRGKK